MVQQGQNTPFPFHLSDLVCWVMKRKDGIVVKYSLKPATALQTTKGPHISYPTKGASGGYSSTKSLGDYCKHDSPNLPTFEVCDDEGNPVLQLRIADAIGVKSAFKQGIEDLIIDAGDVLWESDFKGCLSGDQSLIAALSKHTGKVNARVLKIKWADRAEPDVDPNFWVDLAQILVDDGKKMFNQTGTPLRVLTNCQGGHGRSGTALVCLMMALSDYNPLDAITHLRAVHCARAIESKAQHDYINTVGALLGRVENAHEAEGVKSYKDRFLSLTCETSKPYRERFTNKGKV